jgi:homoserine O-acetyltransferase
MAEFVLASSDTQRHARPLTHARTVTFAEPLELELGESLPVVSVTYESYGQLSPAKDNVVLILHALSGDSHVARHDAEDDPGWWDAMVGPGKPIDTRRYFVLCANTLGGCRGTTGPGDVDPRTGETYGGSFPLITIGDIVAVQRRLLDHLDIPRVCAVIGGSMGGHQALDFATRFPEVVDRAIVLASSAYLTDQALAFDVVGRNAITRDPAYRQGRYADAGVTPNDGLAVARMLAHITYVSRESMATKFQRKRQRVADVKSEFEASFAVGSYLAHQGARFVERFDANSYIALTRAMDMFDLAAAPAGLAAALTPARCRWLVVSFSTDWLFPPEQSQEITSALRDAGKPVAYHNIDTPHGHDAFLLADDIARYGPLVEAFLGE